MDDTTGADTSDEEILAVFAKTEESPLRPPEAAEELPIPAEDMRDRFDELTERALLRRDDDRQSGTAYYLTEEGQSAIDIPDEEISTDLEAQATTTGTQSGPHDQETSDTPPPKPGEEASLPPYEPPENLIETFDPPGTPDQKEKRRTALREAYTYLSDHGEGARSDFVVNVFPQAQGAYEEPSDGWWEDVIRPGLDHLPGPKPVEETNGDVWRFDETDAVYDREE